MTTSLLVTGATGYVGSHLIRKLTQSGFDVHVVTRPHSSLSAIEDIAAQLTIHEHDGTTDGMIKLVERAKPQMVLHLASLFLAQHTQNDIQRLIESNILFPCQLLEAMTINQVPYLVNTGTSWQHHEQQSYNPVNLYAASKQAFEDLLKYYTDTGKIKASSLLLFDTYGPQDPRGKLISLLWKTGLTQTPLAMSPGEQEIDLVHIDDVIAAFECAMSLLPAQQEGHTRYGISSGQPLPLKMLIERFACITGLTLPITLGARPYRPREVMHTWHHYQHLPTWAPRITLEAGLPSSRPIFD